MIKLIEELPEIYAFRAELVRIKCLFEAYRGDSNVLFWQQSGGTLISLADGNMTVYYNDTDIDELREFIGMLSPSTVFGDYKTLCRLGLDNIEKAQVCMRFGDIEADKKSDNATSREIYDLFDRAGLELPEYPFFAVDFCRRLNRGCAQYFTVKDKCAAVSFGDGDYSIINGLASLEKGFGGTALSGIIAKNYGKNILVCCREELIGFYEKYGFKKLYYAGYTVKIK